MRSSVCTILSTPDIETSMSYPDYYQGPHDHKALLILVRNLGKQLSEQLFNKVFEKISSITEVQVADSKGLNRSITVRYVSHYPIENNDWGEFQTHRRVLGLVSVAKCTSQNELNDICRNHESLKVKYSSTLYDSRCIIFGINPDGAICESIPHRNDSDASLGISNDSKQINSQDELQADNTNICDQSESSETVSVQSIGDSSNSSQECQKDLNASVTATDCATTGDMPKSGIPVSTPSNFKTVPLFYPDFDSCKTINDSFQEFISSLFWILESKRVDKPYDKLERIPVYCAPFEKKDFVGIDMESKSNKKRCQGRVKKRLGDLCLQADLIYEAFSHYVQAAEILKSVSDWLWLAGSYEGICSASAVLLYPDLGKKQTESAQDEKAKDPSISNISNGQDSETLSSKNCLSPEGINEKYREAVLHYCKFRNAGIIEAECSIKAAKVLIEQKKYLTAAEFLHNVVSINLNISDEEKIQRFTVLSDLYSEIGFHRKSGFFRRIAAVRCVAPRVSNPSWSQCYKLLFDTLSGYKIQLDPDIFLRRKNIGWPALQIQILQELIGTARKMENNALATRHMTFLLHALFPHLTSSEKMEFAQQLQTLTSRCDGAPVPLTIDNGIVVPPVNLYSIPEVREFRLEAPPAHLHPVKLKNKVESTGPFIFCPIQPSLSNKNRSKKTFNWVEGDVCDISMQVVNPLPVELKIPYFTVVGDVVPFDVRPLSVTLPNGTGVNTIKLSGVPRGTGELKMLGYNSHVLGVKSFCQLDSHPFIKRPQYLIDVIPALPQLHIFTNLLKTLQEDVSPDSTPVVTSVSVTLLSGESCECEVTITNTSNVPVELLDIELESSDRDSEKSMFKWSPENVVSQLPIQPKQSASFTLYIYAVGDFVAPIKCDEESDSLNSNIYSMPGSIFSSGPSSRHSANFFARSRSKRAESTNSLNSLRSGVSFRSCSSYSSLGNSSNVQKESNSVNTAKKIQGKLKVRYSGGPGLTSGYCRLANILINVEINPSLQITKWDVLPGELPNQCYLVFDVRNMTQQEMELEYFPQKIMLIEASETCRIPVPVERCPLEKFTGCTKNTEEEYKAIQRVCIEHVSSLVDLKWSLGGGEKTGGATITGINWTSAMLDLIQMAPLRYDINIDGKDLSEVDDLKCGVGDLVEVEINLHNQMSIPLENYLLWIQCYQDHENGFSNYSLETRLAIIGKDRLYLPLIEKGGQFCHTVGMVFFTPGTYKLDIQSSSQTAKSQHLVPAFQSAHVWTCSPPIEISVLEKY